MQNLERGEKRMFRIAICDDEKIFRDDLKEILIRYMTDRGIMLEIDTFSSGKEFVELGIEMVKYKIVFLDINMDELDGIMTAKKIRENSKDMFIVFVTAFVNYTIEGYKVDAVRYILKDNKNLVVLADTEWLRFIFFPIFTICVITAMIKMSEDIKNKAQENLFFVIACGLAGMNIVVFYLIYDILKRENKLQEERIYRIQVKNQIGMYRSISENFDKQKKMTHEYKNQIMCIDSLIKKKKYDSLESFVNKISGQISKELDFICTNNVIVDAVLNTKYQEIRDKGIVFVFKINDLSSLNISDEDVVVILSNLLNNAIEACEKCRGDKIIKLKIVIEDNNAIISVKNTYENAVIYENGEIQTTKILDTDEHGIGIKNIAETIRKYGGSYVIQNDEREFYFSIMIPLVKSDF